MNEAKFYKWLFSDQMFADLMRIGLILNPETVQCRNCRRVGSLHWAFRARNLTPANYAAAQSRGEDPDSIPCLRCKCKTRLSPRFQSFFAFTDRLNRARTNISYQKVLQIIYHWTIGRSLKDSRETLEISKPSLVDWSLF